jgi:hypothetical protein
VSSVKCQEVNIPVLLIHLSSRYPDCQIVPWIYFLNTKKSAIYTLWRLVTMGTMMKVAFIFLSAVESISAFSPAATQLLTVRTSHSMPVPRSLHVVESAKILPIAYASASAALMFRATKAVTKADTAVLVATSALALFNLGPTDNARLASAKIAFQNTPPASSGTAKQRRQAAKTWRSVVRIKIVGQLVGLLWMVLAKSGNGVMRAAATLMGANMAFFLCGAGGAMHNSNGAAAPMPTSLSRSILMIDTILTVAALIAASSPAESARRAVYAGIFASGAAVGALEGAMTLIVSAK